VDPDDPGSEEQDDQTRAINLHDDIFPASKPFNITLNVQLALIVLLAVLLLYVGRT
jgi:hypothetical protein